MKNYNNESQDQIIASFSNDSIARNKKVINFIKLLSMINHNKIVAVNGSWGSGKTFFVKMVEIIINLVNHYEETGALINEEMYTNNISSLRNITDEQKDIIFQTIERYPINKDLFLGNNTLCLYFNAWEYDNNDDPILSLIYKIINDFPYLSTYMNETQYNNFSMILDLISSSITKGQIKASDYKNSEILISEIITAEEIKEKINMLFEMLLQENCNKLIIIIDELDRCRPLYAIKLLEKIKHYITNDKIIVVLSTNLYQLSNSIKNIYGQNFETNEYLDKVIDITVSLPPIDKHLYIKNMNLKSSEYSNNWFTEVLYAYVDYKKLEMRSINRFINIMELYENHIYLSHRNSSYARKLLEYIFLPYCLGEQMFNTHNYNNFINGIGFQDFINYIKYNDKLIDIVVDCIYDSVNNNNFEEELRKLYERIYKNQTKNSIKIGIVYFDENDIKYYYDLCSLLSDFNLEELNED